METSDVESDEESDDIEDSEDEFDEKAWEDVVKPVLQKIKRDSETNAKIMKMMGCHQKMLKDLLLKLCITRLISYCSMNAW